MKKKYVSRLLAGCLTVTMLTPTGALASVPQPVVTQEASREVGQENETESKEQAVTLSKSIVTSSLTKAAIYGHDANWGRILCAMGYSGAQFDPEQVDLFFESCAGKLQIIANGTATDYSEEKATEILSQEKVTAIADLKAGDAEATAWGCDLTHGYIDINADYRS